MNKNINLAFACENIKLESNPNKAECHTNAQIIAEGLKKLGFKVEVVRGFYVNLPNVIKHSWIEFENKILETDLNQLREDCDDLPQGSFGVLDKEKYSHRYKTSLKDI